MANEALPVGLGKQAPVVGFLRSIGLLLLSLCGGCTGIAVLDGPTMVLGPVKPTKKFVEKALPGLAIVDVSAIVNADKTWVVKGYNAYDYAWRVNQQDAVRDSLLAYGQACFERVASGTRGASRDGRFFLGVECRNLSMWHTLHGGNTQQQFHAKMELMVTVSDPSGAILESATGSGAAANEVSRPFSGEESESDRISVIERALQVALDQAFQRISASKPLRDFATAPSDRRSDGPVPRVSCDLRIIAVVDSSGLCSASGQAGSDRLDVLAKGLTSKLKEGTVVKGESVAVVSLRNRGDTGQGKAIAEELADKVQGALIDTGWFDVKERIDLRGILTEQDLDTAGIVKNESVRKKLAGVKYIVIGGVTVTDLPKP